MVLLDFESSFEIYTTQWSSRLIVSSRSGGIGRPASAKAADRQARWMVLLDFESSFEIYTTQWSSRL
ncbi:MAG: hypothetical protein KDC80_15775, partial [Saprospiraceae bacterium]|nr:hypothetical protein [Saprospiraceae bacterium]